MLIFQTLENGKHTLEQWFAHARNGEAYDPRTPAEIEQRREELKAILQKAYKNVKPPPANQNSAEAQAVNQNTKPDAFRLADFVGEDAARAINEPLPPHADAEYLRDYLRNSVQHVIDRFDEFYRSNNCPLPIAIHRRAIGEGRSAARRN